MIQNNNIDFWEKDLKNKSGGFSTPASYFDNLEEKLMERTKQKASPTKSTTIVFNKWIFAGFAIAAMLLVSLIVFKPSNSTITPMNIQEASLVELDQLASFEEEWIFEELQDDNSEENNMDEIDFLIDEGITSEEIIDAFETPEK
ncbi:MAG: hypothetical protein B7C24_05490 [Bacteroidetes bacterium 4572_77]|nr:MAG: hypothetical protein B7C24_05490 [Bacteroidetes bacterium 4572_77]